MMINISTTNLPPIIIKTEETTSISPKKLTKNGNPTLKKQIKQINTSRNDEK